jgi:ABC-type nickel/cobalt efflux system permease component RcnA
MFGLDQSIAHLSNGTTLLLVIAVAILLGLRHATDPDHVAAVTTLIAGGDEHGTRRARNLGLSWGLGHATTLFLFGLPVVLYSEYLPEPVQQGAETAIGVLIVSLAVWLLVRWRRGAFHVHVHDHGDERHVHVHAHARESGHARHPHPKPRSPWQAYCIGLMHGVGGSAGVGVLIIAAVQSKVVAVLALAILAGFTAVSMTLLTTGFGVALASAPAQRFWDRLAPALGVLSLAFGVWYAAGALHLAPYVF